MAASDRAAGNKVFPRAEALGVIELLHLANHLAFHLSYAASELIIADIPNISNASLAYHERGSIVKQTLLRLSADVPRPAHRPAISLLPVGNAGAGYGGIYGIGQDRAAGALVLLKPGKQS